ncbi:MAG: imidazole glycerol phosphate synthase cyclase subunit, partial [Verrucomicrobiales bacterium]|nr:imidazole glycerol phosphate synthase cyclase subunit [Verrucomicrobiales bacterium]
MSIPDYPIRIISRIDIKGPNVVKGIHLEGLRVLGNPHDFVRLYSEAGADEIFYQDVVASLYGRNSLEEHIERAAEEAAVPLMVGGGIRNLDAVRRILRSGADKVAINTEATKRPEFITEVAEVFGSSTIVGVIEAIRVGERWMAFCDNGRENTGLEVGEWAEKLQELGVGEIVLTSVDREGTGDGCDLGLIEHVRHRLNVPLIVHGGVGSPVQALEVFSLGASALAVAAMFHYTSLRRGDLVAGVANKIEEGNRLFLSSGKVLPHFEIAGITELKDYL